MHHMSLREPGREGQEDVTNLVNAVQLAETLSASAYTHLTSYC